MAMYLIHCLPFKTDFAVILYKTRQNVKKKKSLYSAESLKANLKQGAEEGLYYICTMIF